MRSIAIAAAIAIMIGFGGEASVPADAPQPTLRLPMLSDDSRTTVVHFPDDALHRCIREALGKRENELVTRRQMATLQWVECDHRGVVQLSGIEYAESLYSLDLNVNQISDLTPLAHLTSLGILNLGDNHLVNIAPLAGLTRLRSLILAGNHVSDLDPLANMPMLQTLHLADNQISDLTPLEGLNSLTRLSLQGNWISNLEALGNLAALEFLTLNRNLVSDITALASNPGIGEGDMLWLQRNALSRKAISVDVPELMRRGVEVSFDPVDPISDGAATVEFPDQALERAVRRALHKGEGWRIGAGEVGNLKGLTLAGLGIEDLTGLEVAVGLQRLDLSNNRVAGLAPLAGLTSLRALWLSGNPVSDISPIGGLSALKSLTLDNTEVDDLAPIAGMLGLISLALDGNSLRDVSPLGGNIGLRNLSLSDNEISEIGVLANMPDLRWLSLNGNRISSLEPLRELRDLRHLNISDNRVNDLSPLSGHDRLEELLAINNLVGDLSPLRSEKLALVSLQGNPMGDDAIGHGSRLRQAGVTVLLGHVVPYFPAADGSREGFLRVVNHSRVGGEVFVEAIDDAGVRVGPVRLSMGALQATHLNSEDLQRGNAGKGLSVGIGLPATGDWRLVFNSPLDLEVLSYVRTEDGFVTAMHDVAAGSMLPFFNPGSNAEQRSILRVVNTEAEAAKWLTGGRDDAGTWRALRNGLLVMPGHAFTVTAQALEDEHGLGDGTGKWRLRVPRWPWLAVSLLESPAGHLTNLSTAPAHVERLADGMARHRLPLFLAAGTPRESFARVVNLSAHKGEVEIVAIDDAGNVLGPVRLEIGGRKTVHFNSRDLENGNPAKGLFGGLGAGTGDWRLALTTALELQVLAYVRTTDGFVTAMHDLAPMAPDGSHRVVFFNPGSNTAQVSKLQLINEGDTKAQVTITGIDDGGSPSGTVALTLARREALTLTAAQLEVGADGLSGRLGDGTGKWRLHVHADGPLAVMSLLESPTGHLTNLSTTTAGRSPWSRRGQERRAMVQSLDFDQNRD